MHANGLDAIAAVICGDSAHPEDGGSPKLPYRRKINIENFFSDLGLAVVTDPSRWPTARKSLSTANGNGSDLVRILEALLLPALYAGCPNPYEASELIEPHLEAVGWSLVQTNTKAQVQPVRPPGLSHIQDAVLQAAAGHIDVLAADVEKATQRANEDPTGTVTLACSLIETTCVHIITRHGGDLPRKRSIDPLYKEVTRLLGLTAAAKNNRDVIRDDIYRIFSGLDSVVKGIGALRTHGSDSHGGNERARIDARIARLALDSASTISVFLLESSSRKARRDAAQRPIDST